MLSFYFLSCSDTRNSSVLTDILFSMENKYSSIVSNPDDHYLQIAYTQIDRNRDQKPIFTLHTFNVNNKKYFYPASTVKLPAAVLALDKLRRYESLSIDKDTKLTIASDKKWMSSIVNDSSSENGNATIAQFIKQIFVISDNDAFNRLYEFLGQDYFNQRMWDLGYSDIRVRHRLSTPLTSEQNKYTNSFSFFIKDKEMLNQPMQFSTLPLSINSTKNLIGKSYIQNGELMDSPMNFSGKNFFNISEQHFFLQQIMFPRDINKDKKLYLTTEDYDFLYEWMSKLPRESAHPFYSNYDKYFDSYCKFFMFGDQNEKIPDHIRIYNKVGMAYGFLIDNAYIVDIKNNIEFFLTVSVYSNENQTLNDDQYGYDELTLPFLADFGEKVYNYEISRKRSIVPDLSRFISQ